MKNHTHKPHAVRRAGEARRLVAYVVALAIVVGTLVVGFQANTYGC